MPCMGPDLTAARKEGNKVAKKMLEELINRNEFCDITSLEYEDMIQWPDAKKRWSKAKANFIKSVEDLFVEDACNSF